MSRRDGELRFSTVPQLAQINIFGGNSRYFLVFFVGIYLVPVLHEAGPMWYALFILVVIHIL